MIISLEIEESKAKVFVEFLKYLDFVTIKKSELDNEDYIVLLNERIEEYNSNPSKGREATQVLSELSTKFGFTKRLNQP